MRHAPPSPTQPQLDTFHLRPPFEVELSQYGADKSKQRAASTGLPRVRPSACAGKHYRQTTHQAKCSASFVSNRVTNHYSTPSQVLACTALHRSRLDALWAGARLRYPTQTLSRMRDGSCLSLRQSARGGYEHGTVLRLHVDFIFQRVAQCMEELLVVLAQWAGSQDGGLKVII